MSAISALEIFKIGVGPSSSHTMGPWRAAQAFVEYLKTNSLLEPLDTIHVYLYGSLAKTGKGHGTNLAVMLGLSGEDPVTIDVERVQTIPQEIRLRQTLSTGGVKQILFDPDENILFRMDEQLPYHPNALTCQATFRDGSHVSRTYYSIGGGFVVTEGEPPQGRSVEVPYPIDVANDILKWTQATNTSIADVAAANELSWRKESETVQQLGRVWDVMEESIHRGCHTSGELPGGLRVVRRAGSLAQKLLGSSASLPLREWVAAIRGHRWSFAETIQWVSCFALAVNEENAAFGRVVTAPTNGAAGVVPAVLMHHLCFSPRATGDDIVRFLLTAAQIAIVFKKGSTISAAMGGCQAEIGVSSAMAAAGLTHCLGGSPEKCLMAAEIAMEHHLGMTCDPIGGLVQIPCIERNTMGAIKAITATQIAIDGDPASARVTLDDVVKTMWQTAKDMNVKYKETSEGGLATQIPVNIIEC